MKQYDIHLDFLKQSNVDLPMNAAVLSLLNFTLKGMTKRVKLPQGIVEKTFKIKGHNDAKVDIAVYEPLAADAPLPCLVYFHGGGFSMKAAPHHKALACQYALQVPCKVIMADYRLLPKYRFPVALEDAYAAYAWVLQHAEAFGIDPARIAVGGDSAGGALAAAVPLMAKDRCAALPCFQMLIYPITDRRQTSGSMQEFDDTPFWDSKKNAEMWKIYLKNGFGDKIEYASPAQAPSLKGMPPAYLEVAEYDCLRDEGIAFAKSLQAEGVPTELHETKRTVHGFDMEMENEIVTECLERRIMALQAVFKP